MEENVALDSSKQKKFVKSIKGIKKLIKKNEVKAAVDTPPEPTVTPKKKENASKKKKKRIPRGLVYLSHIPHGFYEHQMTEYFKQFGAVTNARVIKSKRTGRSKGYAFVEFKEPSVAEIVAETMNNYLMGKRLIKAAYIPPEKQRRNAMRKHWNEFNNPSNKLKMAMKKTFNANKDEAGELKKAKKLLATLNKRKKKLKDIGIDYDLFTPVDIPEAILQQIVKNENDNGDNEVKDEKAKQKKKKNKKIKTEDSQETKKEENKTIKEEINKKEGSKDKIDKKGEDKQNNVKVKGNKLKQGQEVNKKQQKAKEDKLIDSGIKHMGDFVKIGEDSEDSDSSLGFDSDEYEKIMGSDEEFDSENDHSDNSDGEDDDIESEEEESSPSPVKKGKKGKILQEKQVTKQQNKVDIKKIRNEQQNKKQGKEMKRKAPQSQADPPKKLKFEKQKSQKQVKKLIKVKK